MWELVGIIFGRRKVIVILISSENFVLVRGMLSTMELYICGLCFFLGLKYFRIVYCRVVNIS